MDNNYVERWITGLPIGQQKRLNRMLDRKAYKLTRTDIRPFARYEMACLRAKYIPPSPINLREGAP
jgi:hypothetical protein